VDGDRLGADRERRAAKVVRETQSWGAARTGQGSQIASVLDGQADTDLRAVTLTPDNRTSIQMTVANGWLAACRPGKESADSAEITTASSAKTQRLHLQTNTLTPEPGAARSAG
jgi:hypothetical protein